MLPGAKSRHLSDAEIGGCDTPKLTSEGWFVFTATKHLAVGRGGEGRECAQLFIGSPDDSQ